MDCFKKVKIRCSYLSKRRVLYFVGACFDSTGSASVGGPTPDRSFESRGLCFQYASPSKMSTNYNHSDGVLYSEYNNEPNKLLYRCTMSPTYLRKMKSICQSIMSANEILFRRRNGIGDRLRVYGIRTRGSMEVA